MSEAVQPLEHLNGAGVLAALNSLGFAYEDWAAGNSLRELIYAPASPAAQETRTLTDELEAFRVSVAIPREEQPRPKRVRHDGGYDFAVAPPSAKKSGLFGLGRRG